MKQKLFITTILLVAILLVVNLLSNEFHLRFDLTDEGQYTLSHATLDILESLEEPVTVKAYFSENLPSNIMKARQDFQELLIEYANRSKGLIQYEFISPSEESDQNEAVRNGVQPVLINVREDNRKLATDIGKLKMENQFLKTELQTADRAQALQAFQSQTPSRTIASRIIGSGTGANLTIGTPVTFDRNGTVRLARGFTSITYSRAR